MQSDDPLLTFGNEMYGWATDLFPINRSLTGEGTLETLKYLKNLLPNLEINSIASGSKVFDWIVPKTWNITQGYIRDLNGNSLIDFKNNNLHVMGYSVPVSGIFTREELSKRVHVLSEQPTAIPYVTSYYIDNWGFCMSLNQWENLGDGPFEILIESRKETGELNYAEIVIPGSSKQEILFSTYVCHPSMANNELSGPVVLAKLMKEIQRNPTMHYTYRAIFVPETIGSLVFLSRNLVHLKENLIAGWVMTCIGDEGQFSYIPSRLGNTYSDKITLELLIPKGDLFKMYSWLDRGSDERQFCAPGVDLPVCSVTKSKYGEYPEYHTSLDNLDFISPLGLAQSLEFYLKVVHLIEDNRTPKIRTLGEPQLGKRNLYPNTSIKNGQSVRDLVNVISYLDGQHNLVEIAKKLSITQNEVFDIIEILEKNNLIY
jgi:aminopeptidase-like protein